MLERSDFLSKYSHILITSPIQSATLSRISQYAWEHSIPLFYIHSVGFYSQFSVQLPPQYPIVDTHPDPTSTQDLRLLSPWPELSAFVAEKCDNLDTLSDHDHGHVPYLLLLLHYLEKWKASHDGRYPENYKQKTAFRELVKSGARTNNPEGGEENFDEAVSAVLKSLNPPSLSNATREVLSTEESKTPTTQVRIPPPNINPQTHLPQLTPPLPQSPNFWVIAHAINLFHQTHALPPLPGSVPDMKAQSSDYIRLQNIYKTKARHDHSDILHIVRAAEHRLGRKTPIDEKEIDAFCKNAASVKLIHGRRLPIADATLQWDPDSAKALLAGLHEPESSAPIAIAFLAYDRFHDEHGRPSGLDGASDGADASAHPDRDALTTHARDILRSLQSAAQSVPVDDSSSTSSSTPAPLPEPLANALHELLRARGGELHNISALTGGMVAQEVIKVVTKQYVPVAGGCVFDGVASRSMIV